MTQPYNQKTLQELGSLGGKVTGGAKAIAARYNGALGGRPGKIYVYGIINLDNGRVEWVGQTKNPKSRFTAHQSGNDARFRRVQFPIGLVILAVTDDRQANEVEKAFFEHYKQHGQCSMNAEKFYKCRDRRLTPGWATEKPQEAPTAATPPESPSTPETPSPAPAASA